MAAIVSLIDYKTWRMGTTAAIGDEAFPFYEKKAERELDRQCFGQLSSVIIAAGVATIVIDDETETLVLADIKNCICEIAEYLYQADQTLAAGQTSFSNDGQSGSFDVSRFAGSGRQKELRTLAKSYLSGSVLLRAGVTDQWHD